MNPNTLRPLPAPFLYCDSQQYYGIQFEAFQRPFLHEESTRINVSIIRTWEINTTTTRTFDFIMMDIEGDQLHGWVSKTLASKFQNYLREGKTVSIENFCVVENKFKRFCPVRHKYSIELNKQSKVDVLNENIVFPKAKFELVKFEDLKDRVNDESYLTDFIGILKKVLDIREYGEKRNRKREMLIEDERLMTHKRRTLTSDSIKTIKDIQTQLDTKLEGECICRATITQVHDELEWYFTSCPTCWKKLKDYKSKDSCSCGSHFDQPALRYMLQLEIQDITRELKVTVFGNEATKLLSTPIYDMIRIEEEEGIEAVSARLNKLVNKQYLFQLRITEYNTMHPTRALTVSAILDQDLNVEKKAKIEIEAI